MADAIAEGLRAPDGSPLDLHSQVDEAEGELVRRVIADVRPSTYLEVGLAYGVSALHATEALRALGRPYTHVVVDALQHRDWHGAGLALLERYAGKDRIRFLEERSEYALPRLAEQGLVVDAAFIDGWHSFDQVAVDFYYVHRMLRVGGVVMLDDADWPSVAQFIRFVRTLPCYELRDATAKPGLPPLRAARGWLRGRDPRGQPSAVALRKVAEDRRPHQFFRPF